MWKDSKDYSPNFEYIFKFIILVDNPKADITIFFLNLNQDNKRGSNKE